MNLWTQVLLKIIQAFKYKLLHLSLNWGQNWVAWIDLSKVQVLSVCDKIWWQAICLKNGWSIESTSEAYSKWHKQNLNEGSAIRDHREVQLTMGRARLDNGHSSCTSRKSDQQSWRAQCNQGRTILKGSRREGTLYINCNLTDVEVSAYGSNLIRCFVPNHYECEEAVKLFMID